MGAGGSSERRASVGAVGAANTAGAPVFQQRHVKGVRGCGVDDSNEQDFLDISYSEGGGIISPQFITSYSNQRNGNSFTRHNMKAPPSSHCSSPALDSRSNNTATKVTHGRCTEKDFNKENTKPLKLNQPLSAVSSNPRNSHGISKVQPAKATSQVNGTSITQTGATEEAEISPSQDGRPVIKSATSSFESRTVSESVRSVRRQISEVPLPADDNKDPRPYRSRSPTRSPNSGDLQIEEVA